MLPVQGTQTTSDICLGDSWAGAWNRPVDESHYVWLPLNFPTSRTVTMSWHQRISIDTATGVVQGF